MDWKNKRALLYRRISTDDQSTYSLSDQQERLEKFCQLMTIKVVKEFEDDYSAKTFNRPGWSKMFDYIKSHKGAANLLLFTNWSRFSRAENIGETYMMIDTLFKLGLQAQAVEQPLDLEIPENRLILAFYVASPMVENLRRASNTRHGMRRAMKQGRFCHRAPFGYKNSHDENDKPILKIIPEKAKLIEQIFTDYLEGRDPQLIIKRAKDKGLPNRGNSTFTRIISNHLYAGLVRVVAWKDEPEQIVKGIHEPIISEDIFYAVQNKLHHGDKGKARIYEEGLPLRGVLHCGNCGFTITGGRSRGKSGRYWNYYRCLRCKGQNFNADKAHRQLTEVLESISIKPAYIQTLITEVDRNLKEIINSNYHEAETLSREIQSAEEKIASLEEKYIEGKLTFETYEKYYPILRETIAGKRIRLEGIRGDKSDLIELYRSALPQMQNLNFLYQSLSLENKQQLLKLIFIGGLYRTKDGYRTPEINPLFDVQNLTINGLVIGERSNSITISHVVPHPFVYANPVEELLRFVIKLAA